MFSILVFLYSLFSAYSFFQVLEKISVFLCGFYFGVVVSLQLIFFRLQRWVFGLNSDLGFFFLFSFFSFCIIDIEMY